MNQLTLISGGARSGKSTLGEKLAGQCGERVLYVATAKPLDGEMQDRIARHQARRPAGWSTLEQYAHLGDTLPAAAAEHDAVLLDCVTIMSTNILFDLPALAKETMTQTEMNDAEEHLMGQIDELLAACAGLPCPVFFVTNEVGLGLVPEYPLSRFFRDVLGRVNQKLAAAADTVWFCVSGIPVRIKP